MTSSFLCLQDRALLCWEWDVGIHTLNRHVSVHHRFLLNGISVGFESTETSPSEKFSPPSRDMKLWRPNSLPYLPTHEPSMDFNHHIRGFYQKLKSLITSQCLFWRFLLQFLLLIHPWRRGLRNGGRNGSNNCNYLLAEKNWKSVLLQCILWFCILREIFSQLE